MLSPEPDEISQAIEEWQVAICLKILIAHAGV
ncbi:MAG: hypothetical protein QOJ70_562 [Acidobacteriota bacterium]|jgi:hypothetical protein|nr:hypothetical protein [Acidobacteriota bacterium]